MRFELSPENWQQGSLLALALIMAVALATDIRRNRIPNALVLVALCAGLLVNLVGPDVGIRSAGLFTYSPGALGLKRSLLGALTGFTIFLPLYMLRAMGAGDVKLMTAIGSFVGAADMLNVALSVILMGGVLAVCRMVWAGNSRQVFENVYAILLSKFFALGIPFDPATQSADKMPYAIAIAAGLLAYGGWIYTDHMPLIYF